MSTDPGPHLLGRQPSPPDDRDFPLGAFLENDDPLDAALAVLQASHAAKATKTWAAVATERIKAMSPSPPPTPDPTPNPTPNPTPDPPPPAPSPSGGAVSWTDVRGTLDQGQTPHCVGFGWAQWGNTDPVEDNFANADGDAIYAECKIIDGEPGQQNGSNVRSGAKAMKNRSRLNTYAFASSIDEATKWVLAHGPVVMGTDWTNDMFNPDGNHFVKPTGGVAGGHCYLLVGYDPGAKVLEFQNSWGSSWGKSGRFYMHQADAEKLFTSQGEACAAVELPLG
jgi:hypothetical protein